MISILRETHDTPQSVADRLTSTGGLNRYGEPNYRAVWGWNRLSWIGGKFEDRDEHGLLLREVVELRQEPKYSQVNRWHVERWVPPEAYGTPQDWYAQTIESADGLRVPALGPYPERGEYEHCFTIQSPAGEFVQLTPAIVERVAHAIEWSRQRTRAKTRAELYQRASRNEQQYENWAYDVLDSNAPAFHGLPFVALP